MRIGMNNNNTHFLHPLSMFLAIFSMLVISTATFADQKPSEGGNAGAKSNPVGAGSGWNAEVKTGDDTGRPIDMDDETVAFVQSISDYFNAIKHMQGLFKQTNPDNQATNGRFYVKRPGRLRFDYAAPSKLRIVADGKWLSIEDHDIKTVDRYPLESTPFRLLLAANVDLLKDSKIVDISRGDDVAIISVSDKADDSSGQLKLFFTIPELQLTQWIITDPQGLDTRIEISKLKFDEKKDNKFFDVADVSFETQGN